jgi:hypothetical protein
MKIPLPSELSSSPLSLLHVKKESFVDQLTTTSMKKIQQQQKREKENDRMGETFK